MKKKAIIVSINGSKLSKKERLLLSQEYPWGLILFKRNIKSFEQVKKLIETEDIQFPISDDEIVERLKKDGINVARRTVAKYRKVQKIPASFMRKRQSTLSGLI